jgi:hypothetical protein|tara:strand:- start:1158 stop:1655 length:498 start_codon:yes stop_codon:yes gene_type:complete
MKIKRKWAMPNHNTFSIKPIREFIGEVPIQSIDPFARNSKLATITNDLNPDFDTTHNMDALDFLKTIDDNSVDMVLFDPPYSPRQLKECYDSIGKSLTQSQTQSSYWAYCKDEITRITKPGGIVLSFGWNTQGMGKSRGFEIESILLVPHGGMHNDTICVKEVKK